MGQHRGRGPCTGRGIVAHRTSLGRVAVGLAGAAVGLAVISVMAGCGSSGPASGSSSPAARADATATASAAAAKSASATASAAAASAPIVEPFDPRHPARTRPAPASCGGQSTTVAIEQCYEARTENADAAIDAVQMASYQRGPATRRAAILSGDRAWLAARQPVCAKAFHSRGSIDGINVAGCLLAESTARLDAVQGTTPTTAICPPTRATARGAGFMHRATRSRSGASCRQAGWP